MVVLPGAVRSKDPEDLTGLDIERDIGDRQEVAIPLAEVLHRDHWFHIDTIAASSTVGGAECRPAEPSDGFRP